MTERYMGSKKIDRWNKMVNENDRKRVKKNSCTLS